MSTELNKTQTTKLNGFLTKSAKIRYLASLGLETKDVYKVMKGIYPNFIYQHARNVMNKAVKKPIEQV